MDLQKLIKQQEIKHDLELSHLTTKLHLLEETCTNKNVELKSMKNFQENNEKLIVLLERYDQKVSEVQHELDIKNLEVMVGCPSQL